LENVLEILDSIDRSLFIFLNGIHHPFFDFIMFWASDRFIWIPFYAFLIFLIIKKFGIQSVPILFAVGLVVIISDQVTSGIMKPLFERFRPCHNPELAEYVHLVGRCGGRYGFASSHAANTFGAAMFLWFVFNGTSSFAWVLFVWAGIVSYSRIYLGVHYPGDIFAGSLIGILAAMMVYYLLLLYMKKWHKKNILADKSMMDGWMKKHS
jgi:undecaprenyl-diphosphatase